MSSERYDVVLSGQPLEGFELDEVKCAFAQLFSLAETRAEQIFNRGNVVIKKNVAEPVAQKFVKALEQIGAAAHLHPLSEISVSSVPEPTSEPASPSSLSGAVEAAAPPVDAAATPLDKPEVKTAARPFEFHGNGFEYFKIWIVNVLLTIVTLGIYSAWAKVRNNQYFYGNTELAGSRFGYHAKPLTILKGRIIAVVLFASYSAVSNLYPVVGFAMAICLMLLVPWIVMRSLRFNRRMTSWRNIRFGFDGRWWPAVQAFVLWPLLATLSIGAAMFSAKHGVNFWVALAIALFFGFTFFTMAYYRQRVYIIENSRFGTSRFEFQPCAKAFVILFALLGVLIFVAIQLVWHGRSYIGFTASAVLPMLIYFYAFALFSVYSTNLIYNNSSLHDGDFGFVSQWRTGSYLKLLLVNTLLTLLTLGFFYPWARVRVARYKSEHLQLQAQQDLEGFIAGEAEQVSALGEEFGDVFDMEVGL